MIRLLRDFDRAEEVVQEAFAAAVAQWPVDGTPADPAAWIMRAAKNKAIDRIRRSAHIERPTDDLAALSDARASVPPPGDDDREGLVDDRLRLMFTCCHPALAEEAQVALTLRTLSGLSTDEIARAFLVPPPTMAQRLVRAKTKIRAAGIPFVVPPESERHERLAAVMSVIYLVFNEGYAASTGDALVRRELSGEAIRLGRTLLELTPDASEVMALVALMLLHDARRDARVDPNGELLLLDEQDRTKWHRSQIDEGLELVERALRAARRQPGPYALQSAVAALHARAAAPSETDWRQIAAIYALQVRLFPSPVVELNHAVAVAMVDGPAAGLVLLDALDARRELDGYHLLPAARADLLVRVGDVKAARAAYERALSEVGNEPERRFLLRRLRALAPPIE